MKQIIIFIGLIGLMVPGCKKTEPHHTINSGLYNAYAFKTGTYWIYKDSISGEVDSFAVNVAGFENYPQTGYIQDVYYCYLYTYRFNSIHNLYKFDSSVYGYVIYLFDTTLFFNSTCPGLYEDQLRYALFVYPKRLNQFFILKQNDSANIEYLYNSYSLNGLSFTNIAQIHHYSSVFQGGVMQHDDWFYVCDNVGIVKMIFNHPQDSVYRNWELIRYHIVK